MDTGCEEDTPRVDADAPARTQDTTVRQHIPCQRPVTPGPSGKHDTSLSKSWTKRGYTPYWQTTCYGSLNSLRPPLRLSLLPIAPL